MTGNFYALLAIAEAIVSLLPAVGPAAARTSRTIVHRTSNYRTALIDRVSVSFRGIRAGRRRIDAAGPNATRPTEELSPCSR